MVKWLMGRVDRRAAVLSAVKLVIAVTIVALVVVVYRER